MVMSDFQDVDDDGEQVEHFKKAAKTVDEFFQSHVTNLILPHARQKMTFFIPKFEICRKK
jgi:hypothetical protein